jgi:multidrug efflux pump
VQDKQYLVSVIQLPDGASLDRTEAIVRQVGEIALKEPGVQAAVQFPGLSVNGLTNSSNSAVVFLAETPFDERKSAAENGPAVAARLNQKFAAIQGATIGVFPPPMTSSPRPARRPNWPACSPASRSTSRSFMPTSTAPRRGSCRSR